jgi:hypothetical protein
MFHRYSRLISLLSIAFAASVCYADDPQPLGTDVKPEPLSLEAPSEPEGMQSIFNRMNLSGWIGDPRLWTVTNGKIRGETTPENSAKGNTFLIWTGGKPKDFDLRLSYRVSGTNNSGIQYRSKHITDSSAKNNWVVRGYQFELRNENTLPSVSGFIYDEGGKRGRLCLVGEKAVFSQHGSKEVSETVIDEAAYQKLMKIDDWNEAVIIAKGNRIRHYLNGKLLLDFTDESPTLALEEGQLALQLHAGKPMWAEFKDIRLKELKK